mmetsp:Transcript_6448/g.16018  ORF Transcript_6448/g.16018 Transcript_6448/m.16018 type:complete len:699 (+) Transcript_6448:1476-3572(+)
MFPSFFRQANNIHEHKLTTMTTVDNHHIVNSHSSVGTIPVTGKDTAIKSEDGTVILDEEIDSCEGEDYDEKKMIQVALVNSVMDKGGKSNGSLMAPQQEAPGEMSPRSKARYALRKRRRPGEEAVVAPQTDGVMNPEPDTVADFLDIPNDPLNELQHVQENSCVAPVSLPPIQLPVTTPIKTEQEPLQEQSVSAPTQTNIGIQQTQRLKVRTGATAGGLPHPGIISKPLSTSQAVLSRGAMPIPQQNGQQQQQQQQQPIIKTNLTPAVKLSGTKKKAPRKRKPKAQKVAAKTKVAERLSIPVPNPLLAVNTPPAHPSINPCVQQDAAVISSSSVPCPLPVPSPLDVGTPIQGKGSKKVTYIPPFDPTKLTKVSQTCVARMEPPLIHTRSRVFSVDLDPSTFDFSDLSSLTDGNVDKASADAVLPIFQGRDRAFSFEVFNFAGGDDLLPNPASSASLLQAPSLGPVAVEAPSRRPRGDSIIFDPASFQDGGIHEKNALEKARLKDLVQAAPPQQQLLSHPATQRRPPAPSGGGITGTYSTSQSSNPLPLMLPAGSSLNHASPIVASQNRISHPGRSTAAATAVNKSRSIPTNVTNASRVASSSRNTLSTSAQMATLPSSLSAGTTSNAQSPPTFQMELLNKDGRIGIYLPEARRARIARFHAKRKMRIWRKRIKYDCRKKLADSRPRIKGRFVKRSDMD